MPVCRNCGARISKFDKDRCPVCGQSAPLKGVTSETVDVTSQISFENKEFNYKPKDRGIIMLLFTLCGFTGSGFFYIKKNSLGFIWLIANVVFLAALILIFFLATKIDIVWAIVIPFIISYIINIGVGVYYLLKSDIKDGRGEFIR